jgi:hypothetical protein
MHRLRWLISPEAQVPIAVAQLVAVVIGWPLSAVTIARDEPQVVLGLSWLALFLTAHNSIISSVANRKIHEGEA